VRIEKVLPVSWNDALEPTALGVVLSRIRNRTGHLKAHYANSEEGMISREQYSLESISDAAFLQALGRWREIDGKIQESELADWVATGNTSAVDVSSPDPYDFQITQHARQVYGVSGLDKTGMRFKQNRFALYADGISMDYLHCKSVARPEFGVVFFSKHHPRRRTGLRTLTPTRFSRRQLNYTCALGRTHLSFLVGAAP
jgi:hypothetical protein